MTLRDVFVTHELPAPEGKTVRIAPRPLLRDAEASIAALLEETKNESIEIDKTSVGVSRERRDISKSIRWFAFSDLFALTLGFFCALALTVVINNIYLGRTFRNLFAEGDALRLGQFFIISLGVGLWFEHKGHYCVRMPFWLEVKKIVGTMAFAMIIDGFLQFASKQEFSRVWLVSIWVFTGVFVVLFRSLLRSYLIKKGLWQIPTLLIGDGATADDARAALKSEPSLGYEIVAQVKKLPESFRKAGGSWEAMCAKHGADYILVALEGNELSRSELQFAQLMRENVPFSVSPPLRHLPVLGMVPHYFFNHDVMLLTRNSGLEQPMPRFIKRSFDIVISSMALLFLSPLFLFISVLVKVEGGDILFPNRRIGMNGKEFDCLKFRSMVEDSDEVLKQYLANADPKIIAEWQSHKKLRGDDPRVTRMGRLLRKLSFDELPQLINVLKGDMSLVGPRPILPRELDEYGSDIAHYCRIRPGITGLWQVSGRNEVTYARRVQMDSWYVRNWSIWHDIAILCKTVPVLFKRTGAY